MPELIIAEKPNAAKKIAEALADSKVHKGKGSVPFYEIRHNGEKITVACAVGHLFTVSAPKKTYTYPQFDTLWEETYKVDKNAAFTKNYVTMLKQLSRTHDVFTVATDFDIEGEVIGYNVIKHICKEKDAHRMIFSTLTKDDIVEAYANKRKTLDWGQANAGVTRHELDWYYGINLSSALMSAIKKAGMFKVLSSGRVQGPALKMLADKEREIRAFIPEPYWQVHLAGTLKGQSIEAFHKEEKIPEEKRADEILEKTKGKPAAIADRDVKTFKQAPPHPFDLTSFQVECYRVHKISPKETLSIAQELYVGGFISYPRTSSQKLPAKLGFKKILQQLQKQSTYAEPAAFLLSKPSLQPNEGKKTDEAHPAIYPTGQIPDAINPRAQKVYDLVVRRFLATFGDPAVRETVRATIAINQEPFICKGIVTKEKGWHILYGKYATFDEVVLPPFVVGDPVAVKAIEKLSKETKPPKRYTQASIISELEKRNLGTKATRAQIIDNLYNRGYVNNKSMEVTDLGMKTCDILEKYAPEILDEQLTRRFEEELEQIRKKKLTPNQVLAEAQQVLTSLLEKFKKQELTIGTALKEAQIETRDAAETIGKCPNCEKGTLKIRKGKYGQFIGCDSYPDCKTIFNIPRNAIVKPSKKVHESGLPMILIQTGKRTNEVCVDPKYNGTIEEQQADEGEKVYPEEGMACPNCSEGKMVLRKSFYGSFLGCNRYPTCKTMMKIEDGKVNTTPVVQEAKKRQPKQVKTKSTKKTVKKATKKTARKSQQKK